MNDEKDSTGRVDYKKLYYALFAEVSKITDQLVQIQQDTEERFLDMSEEE